MLWCTLAFAAPPTSTAPLPDASPEADGPRASTKVAPMVWTPADIAGWAGRGLRGARVVDLLSDGNNLWAATLGGGLARWDGAAWTHLTRRHRLPGDLTLALAGKGPDLWVGTDWGLAQVRDDAVVAVWNDSNGLPDSYTQTVSVDGDTVWAGTYKGLAKLEGAEVSPVLTPWSCFSLLRGPDNRMWVGYEGMRGLPQGEPIEGIDPELRLYDVEATPDGFWLASREHGLIWWDDGISETFWDPPSHGVFAIARSLQDLFVAAEADGVWQIAAKGKRRRYTIQDGLPSDVANEVIEGPANKVWVGTNRGVALLQPNGVATPLPLAPLPAGIAVRDSALEKKGRGVAVASEDGLVWVGDKSPKGWGSLVAAVPDPIGVFRNHKDWWALTHDAAFQLTRGEVVRWKTDAPLVDGFRVDAGVVLVTQAGPRWWVPKAKMLSPVGPLPDTVSGDGLGAVTWFAGPDQVVAEGPVDRTWQSIPGPRDIAADPSGAWVASEGGLYRIDGWTGDVIEVSEGWGAGGFVAVDAHNGAFWAANEAGVVWGPGLNDVPFFDIAHWDEYAEVTGLQADDHGVWIHTTRGLFRITAF